MALQVTAVNDAKATATGEVHSPQPLITPVSLAGKSVKNSASWQRTERKQIVLWKRRRQPEMGPGPAPVVVRRSAKRRDRYRSAPFIMVLRPLLRAGTEVLRVIRSIQLRSQRT